MEAMSEANQTKRSFPPTPVPLTWGDDGVIRVGDTRVSLETIFLEYEIDQSPDRLVDLHPDLTPEVVHAVLAYVLNHPDEVKRYLLTRIPYASEARTEDDRWDWLKRWPTWAIAGISAVGIGIALCGWNIAHDWPSKLTTLFSFSCGLSLGITLGVLASPLDDAEGKQLAGIGSVVSAFVGGFLLSKVDRLFEDVAKSGAALQPSFLVPVLEFGASTLLAAVLVWLWRKYGWQ
jgi:uncharacterized protein (DUF433 family)